MSATTAGAWVSTISAFLVLYIPEQAGFGAWARGHAAFLLLTPDADAVYLPMQMALYLTVGVTSMVLVSLATRPVDRERFEAALERVVTERRDVLRRLAE